MNAPYRIIIADDDATIRLMLRDHIRRSFREKEFTFDQVIDGETLVARVRAETYDMIFSDNDMPTMNGIDAVCAIRTFNHETPVFLISADSDDIAQRAYAAGATHFLPKPYNLEDLRTLLTPYFAQQLKQAI